MVSLDVFVQDFAIVSVHVNSTGQETLSAGGVLRADRDDFNALHTGCSMSRANAEDDRLMSARLQRKGNSQQVIRRTASEGARGGQLSLGRYESDSHESRLLQINLTVFKNAPCVYYCDLGVTAMRFLSERRKKQLKFGLLEYPTRKLRGEPHFLIVGAEKAGTTSMFDYINQHPDVAIGHRKEVQYFSRYFYHSWDWYRAHFPLRSQLNGKMVGEASPYYMFHPYAAERIHSTLPACKIIMLLREPITRSISQYYHEIAKGRETLSLPEAFAAEAQRVTGEVARMSSPLYLPFNHEHFSYVGKSVYADQVRRYLRVFPRQQLLILQSERFFTETPQVLRETFNFLELDADYVPPNLRASNVSYRQKEELPSELRQRLESFFHEKNEELYELIGERYDW
jgi:hypothetical protein